MKYNNDEVVIFVFFDFIIMYRSIYDICIYYNMYNLIKISLFRRVFLEYM